MILIGRITDKKGAKSALMNYYKITLNCAHFLLCIGASLQGLVDFVKSQVSYWFQSIIFCGRISSLLLVFWFVVVDEIRSTRQYRSHLLHCTDWNFSDAVSFSACCNANHKCTMSHLLHPIRPPHHIENTPSIQVPEDQWKNTPIWLKATAGLRLVEKNEALAVLNSVRDFLGDAKNSPFYFRRSWARMYVLYFAAICFTLRWSDCWAV